MINQVSKRDVVKLLLLVLINISHKTTLKQSRSDTIKAVMQELQSKHMNKAGDPPAPPDVNFKYPIVIFSDDISSGGRLYNSWWTGCKKEYRQYLRIDDEQCVELDFTAMHPNILYQLEGYPPQNDIYIYDKSESEHMSLEYKEIESLLQEIETRHDKIKKHFYNAAWRYCTFQESTLIREIIKAAMAKNILVLSVHDSIICKAKDIEKISAIIQAKTDLPVTQKMYR